MRRTPVHLQRITLVIVLSVLCFVRIDAAQCSIKSSSIHELNARAVAAIQEDKWDEVKACLLAAYKIDPRSPATNFHLGLVAEHEGDAEAAVRYFEIPARGPPHAPSHFKLGLARRAAGDLDGAIASFQEALKIDPNMVVALSALGTALNSAGRYEEAIPIYERALALEPRDPALLVNAGVVYVNLNRLDEGQALYQRGVEAGPDVPEAHYNLGSLLQRHRRDPLAAIPHLQTALRLREDFVEAHHSLAAAYQDLAKWDQALQHAERALALSPRSPSILNTLGNILSEVGDAASRARAIRVYKQAIAIDKRFSVAYSNLGRVLKLDDRMEEAVKVAEIAVKLDPNSSAAHTHLGDAYKDTHRIQEAVQSYRRALELDPSNSPAFCYLFYALQFACDWSQQRTVLQQLRTVLNEQLQQTLPVHQCVHPFMAIAYPLSNTMLRRIATKFAEKITVTALESYPNAPHNALSVYTRALRQAGGRLRVGYVSPDFGDHPVGKDLQFAFGMHDRERVEVFCYALNRDDQTYWRRHAEQSCEHFVEIADLTLRESYDRIYADRIHILVDIAGYTKGVRSELFALQAAPLQVTYKGFMGTTGAPFINWTLTDRIVVPPHLAFSCSERLVYLPVSFFTSDYAHEFPDLLRYRPDETAAAAVRRRMGIPPDAFVFANFNQLYKIDPDTFAMWMRILKRVPGSVLWLQATPEGAVANLQQEAERLGIDRSRLVFSKVVPWAEHLRIKSHADLFIDTPMYNAHGSGTDALWAGLPLLTLPQRKMSSRVAASLVTALGVPELVMRDAAEYEQRAVQLATDRAALSALRARVEHARLHSSLFDTGHSIGKLDRAYHLLWDQHVSSGGRRAHVVLRERPYVPSAVFEEAVRAALAGDSRSRT